MRSVFLVRCIFGLCYNGYMQEKVEKWLDEAKMAAEGVVLSTKNLRFWAIFVPVLIIFGTLLSMLSAGMGAVNLFFASDFGGKLQILGDAFLSLFGKDRTPLDFLQNFIIAILQALLISLIAMVYQKRKQKRDENRQKQNKNKQERSDDKQERNGNKQKQGDDKHKQDDGAVQNAGIAAGLALLGSGCPTCGTTLITPILVSLFSTSGYAVAGMVSGIITLLAVLLLLWSLKRVGVEAYAIMVDEKWRKKRQKEAPGAQKEAPEAQKKAPKMQKRATEVRKKEEK